MADRHQEDERAADDDLVGERIENRPRVVTSLYFRRSSIEAIGAGHDETATCSSDSIPAMKQKRTTDSISRKRSTGRQVEHHSSDAGGAFGVGGHVDRTPVIHGTQLFTVR